MRDLGEVSQNLIGLAACPESREGHLDAAVVVIGPAFELRECEVLDEVREPARA
jgi:hypothetical protein